MPQISINKEWLEQLVYLVDTTGQEKNNEERQKWFSHLVGYVHSLDIYLKSVSTASIKKELQEQRNKIENGLLCLNCGQDKKKNNSMYCDICFKDKVLCK